MRLKELRKKNKQTQLEIAKFLNIATTTYGGYELETSEPTIDTLCKLADFYKVSLDYLVGRNFAYEVGYLTENEKNMLAMFRQLNKDNQIRVIGETAGILIGQN